MLSIVVPAYNEARRLGGTLEKIFEFCSRNRLRPEIIVVDDGSTDATREVTRRFESVELTPARENRGKGYSARQGMLLARGDPILLTDADLSTPITELPRFIRASAHADVVVGSRAMAESEVESRWYKVAAGRVSHLAISALAVRGIRDTQCGFKLFRRQAARDLFQHQTLEGFGFDFEILHLAQRYGYVIKELPVPWVEDRESKVSWRDYPRTFKELWNVTRNRVRGVYDR